MAWTPTLKLAEKQNGKIHVVIQYSDGVTTFPEDIHLTSPTTLNDIVATRITQLNALDTYLGTLTVGAPISTTPTPPATLTQAQIDQNTWVTDYRTLVRAKTTLVDTGVIPASNPTYAALLQSVQTRLSANPTYFNAI